jgi:hypothetical protein
MFTDVAGALQRAYSRLDYLAADPRRNAENAVKVLVKFLLLERQRIALDAVAGLLAGIPVVGSAVGLMDVAALTTDPALFAAPSHGPTAPDTYTTLANWAISSLLRANAARIDGDFLLDA